MFPCELWEKTRTSYPTYPNSLYWKNTSLPRILSFYAATCGHIVFCSIPISKPPLNGSSDRSCRTLSSALPGLLLPLWIWWESFCPTEGCKSCIWQVCNPKDLWFGQGSNLKIHVFIRDQEIKLVFALCKFPASMCRRKEAFMAFAISTTMYQQSSWINYLHGFRKLWFPATFCQSASCSSGFINWPTHNFQHLLWLDLVCWFHFFEPKLVMGTPRTK